MSSERGLYPGQECVCTVCVCGCVCVCLCVCVYVCVCALFPRMYIRRISLCNRLGLSVPWASRS